MTMSLPSYGKPPVYEVALAVQFETDRPLGSADLASIRSLLAPDYPIVRDMPPLGRMTTDLERTVEFEFSSTPPVPRYWFLSQDESHLVQLQRDRIAVNWRRQGDDPYPRYDTITPRLEKAWTWLVQHLAEFGYEEPRPDVAEVTYVNPIEATPGIWEQPSELGAVFEPWSGDLNGELHAELQTAALNLQFTLPGTDGGLRATVQPATNNETGRAALMLTLVARGNAENETFEGALRFLDIGHEAIVRTFTALTTNEMHTHWERIQ